LYNDNSILRFSTNLRKQAPRYSTIFSSHIKLTKKLQANWHWIALDCKRAKLCKWQH